MAKASEQFTNRLGGILRKIREDKKLTRETVAQHIGKTPRHLAAIELGQRCPSIDMLHDLICFYGVSADCVFYPDSPGGNPVLERVSRLTASCTQEQQEFIAEFIELIKMQKFKE